MCFDTSESKEVRTSCMAWLSSLDRASSSSISHCFDGPHTTSIFCEKASCIFCIFFKTYEPYFWALYFLNELAPINSKDVLRELSSTSDDVKD